MFTLRVHVHNDSKRQWKNVYSANINSLCFIVVRWKVKYVFFSSFKWKIWRNENHWENSFWKLFLKTQFNFYFLVTLRIFSFFFIGLFLDFLLSVFSKTSCSWQESSRQFGVMWKKKFLFFIFCFNTDFFSLLYEYFIMQNLFICFIPSLYADATSVWARVLNELFYLLAT